MFVVITFGSSSLSTWHKCMGLKIFFSAASHGIHDVPCLSPRLPEITVPRQEMQLIFSVASAPLIGEGKRLMQGAQLSQSRKAVEKSGRGWSRQGQGLVTQRRYNFCLKYPEFKYFPFFI